MAKNGKSAWLITWEGPDANRLGRCKIVAILSSHLGEQNITLLLRALFCSEYPLTLCEKLSFGTARAGDMPDFLLTLHRDINQAFAYGHFPKDYLYARRVRNLRCEASKENVWKSTLHWVELPKYTPVPLDASSSLPDDISQLTKMVTNERHQSYTYTTPHATDLRTPAAS
jgi:hypothetical protein